jgi:CRISPR-associated protein Csb1
MTDILKHLIETTDLAAVTLRQTLVPVEGPETPIFPATYPAPERGAHRFDTPYTVNQTKDATLVADIDSVQSQANRMEAAFSGPSGPLQDLVPQHSVKAGEREVRLTDLSHRIADAAIRATDLAETIHRAMLDYAKGDPGPLARLAPTSLIYGAWDSRDTHVKIPRAVRSEIRAFDCSIFTRSAQFTGAFDKHNLELSDKEWEKGANVGFAPTPSVNAHGGVLVHGEIVHTASILLPALRRYVTQDDSALATYLLGLALSGLLHATRDYNLRSGCWLVAQGAPVWQTVSTDGTRAALTIEPAALGKEVETAARTWAETFAVTLGGEPVVHAYDAKIGKRMVAKGQDEA